MSASKRRSARPLKRANPNRFVFINCPFDSEYRPLFEAIVFAIYACGFVPRCALEEIDGGHLRLLKIIGLIDQCTYGVHDISRTELDSTNQLPRFNMPFELGLALGRKHSVENGSRPRMLIFDREPYRYQTFISDLAGCDISSHCGCPVSIAIAIRNWLSQEQNEILPGPKHLKMWFALYQSAIPGICEELGLAADALTFTDLAVSMNHWFQRRLPIA